MNKFNRNLLIVVGVIVLFLTVGYALLSANLSINGTSIINNSNWDIHLENVQVTSGSVAADEPEIDSDGVTVTYDVTLSKPGDFYEFTVDAVNGGSIDAMIDTIVSTLNNTNITTLPAYLDYKVTYSDGMPIETSQQLNAGDTEIYKIRLEYKKDLDENDLPQTQQELNLSFTANYVQKDTGAKPVHHPSSFATDSWDAIGAAVHNGNISAYNVGDTKEVDMGSLGTHTVRIANKSTPADCNQEVYSQTACGFVLEFTDIISVTSMNPTATSAGGWESSALRTYINGDVFNALPSDLKNKILSTFVMSGHESGVSRNYMTNDHLYLLSTKEVGLDVSYDTSKTETRTLDYYGASASRVKKYQGSNTGWWLRGAYGDGTTAFTAVHEDGRSNTFGADMLYGVSPAFRIG